MSEEDARLAGKIAGFVGSSSGRAKQVLSKASGSRMGQHVMQYQDLYGLGAMSAQALGSAHAYKRKREGRGPFGGRREPLSRTQAALRSQFDLW